MISDNPKYYIPAVSADIRLRKKLKFLEKTEFMIRNPESAEYYRKQIAEKEQQRSQLLAKGLIFPELRRHEQFDPRLIHYKGKAIEYQPSYCEKDEDEAVLHDPEFLDIEDFSDKVVIYPTPLSEYDDPKLQLESPVKNSLRKKVISQDIRKKTRVKSMLNLEFLREIHKSNVTSVNDFSKERDAIQRFTKQAGPNFDVPGNANLRVSGADRFLSGSLTTRNKRNNFIS